MAFPKKGDLKKGDLKKGDLMKRDFKLRLPLYLVISWVPVLMTGTGTAWAQSLPPPPTATYEAYGYVDDHTDALLHLSENADLLRATGYGTQPYPIPVIVSLRLNGSSTPAVTFNATVPVYGVLEISLKSKLPPLTNAAQPGAAWGNGLNAHSAWLNATITLASGAADPDDILAVNHELATFFTAPGVQGGVSGTRRLGGTDLSTTVWRPAATTRLYLVLQEVSGAANNAYLSWNNGPYFQNVYLPANGGAMVELTNSLPVNGSGDIEVNTGGNPVTATALAIDETTGMALAQLLLNPPLDSTLYSPPIKINGWGAKVAIANLSYRPAYVLATLTYYNSSNQLMSSPGLTFQIPGNSAVIYDLPTLTNGFMPSSSSPGVSLRFDNLSCSQGCQMAATIFGMMNGSTALVTPWPMYDSNGGAQEKSAVGFGLGIGSDATNAAIGGTNVGPTSTTMFLIVSYVDAQGVGHQYGSAPVTVDPGGFVWWNIRGLRDSQTPDANGNVLPADLTTGNAHLWSSIGGLAGMDMTWNEANHWAIQCGEICLPGTDVAGPRCRVLRQFQPPVIETQLYHRTGWVPRPGGPPGSGIAIMQACSGVWLTNCGALKPVWAGQGFIQELGVAVKYLDLNVPLSFIFSYELCIPLDTHFFDFNPCPGD
jgi:hypothetical protein